MPLPITPAELLKPEVLRSQRREWIVERSGWVVLALILVSGLLGLFGGGPMAHASLSTGSINLEYERIVRHSVNNELRLQVGGDHVVDGGVEVSLDGGYLEAVELQDVIPHPVTSVSSPERTTWGFAADASGSLIVFVFAPRRSGRQAGQLEIGGKTALAFKQFVFP